jgi:hypothetical protein
MDDRERDKFYSSNPDDADDEDLELEPPDPTVLAGEQLRAKETLESTRIAIDIDNIYREAERDPGREFIENWLRNYRFRFQVKHLLVATAVLAILLTLAKKDLMIFVVIGVMLTIAGVYLYFQWLERKHQEEANRRRQELYARRREQLANKSPADAATAVPAPSTKPIEPLPPLPNEIDEIWEKARAEQPGFQFRFSMKQLMAAMTTAAVIFGLMHIGGPEFAATLLGLVALVGLVIHAIGFEPPQTIVLGWWLILVLYVALSIISALWGSIT